MNSLFYLWVVRGGIMMIFLVPALVLMIAFTIQAFLNLRRSRVAPPDFAERVRAARQFGGYERASQVVHEASHSLAEIVKNVEIRLSEGATIPAEILRQEIEKECDALVAQNSHLSLIYRVAPQMGLLGTVFGMIQTFNEFAESTTPEVSELAKGINVALITTAWGLSIAIPAYLIFHFFMRQIAEYEQVVLPAEATATLEALLDINVADPTRPVTSGRAVAGAR